jgi:hypothetical protein
LNQVAAFSFFDVSANGITPEVVMSERMMAEQNIRRIWTNQTGGD